MSSTPTTGGFQVSVMPQVQLADPRLFNPWGALGQGLESGMNMGARLQDIYYRGQQNQQQQEQLAYERSMRPMQMQHMMQQGKLADIQMQDAERRRQLADLQLPGERVKASLPITEDSSTYIEKDEDGNEVQYMTKTEIDPATGQKQTYTGIPVKTLRTAEQVAQDSMLSAARAKAYESRGSETGQLMDKYNQALQDGDLENAQIYKRRIDTLANPGKETVRRMTDKDGNIYVQRVDARGQPIGGYEQQFVADGVPAKARPPITVNAPSFAAQGAVANPVAAAPAAAAAAPAQAASTGFKLDFNPSQPVLADPQLTPMDEVPGEAPAFDMPAAPKVALSSLPPQQRQGAIQMLLDNPALAPQFDAMFGAGSAAAILTPRK